jgi:hypothetical protein
MVVLEIQFAITYSQLQNCNPEPGGSVVSVKISGDPHSVLERLGQPVAERAAFLPAGT